MIISIAIDGPAGAGKSTIAKLVANNFDLMYINTGSMYRAVTLKALENHITPDDTQRLLTLIDGLSMHFCNDRLILNGLDINDELSLPSISSNVSAYASIKEVREMLVKLQQHMAKNYNVIMDGRDIGTVVLKDAPFKFFLTATAEERANRRFKELCDKNIDVSYEKILDDIKKRDYLDSHRDIDPLKKAEDAMEIDTTGLNIEQVVKCISDKVNEGLKRMQIENV